MLIISSSAKTLDLTTPAPAGESAHFLKQSNGIQALLAKMDVQEFSEVLGVSEKIAIQNVQRMQEWDHASERPSLFCYKGDVYRELHPLDYSSKELEYAARSLFAMSGLYGAVGAMQSIKPYRLEMKAKLEGYGSMNEYWRPYITEYFNQLIDQDDHKCLLNLASKEYSKAVDREKLKVPVIDVDFKEEREGRLKIVGIMAKRARGMMIDYCIRHQVESLDELRRFNAAGYEFIGEENGVMTFAR